MWEWMLLLGIVGLGLAYRYSEMSATKRGREQIMRVRGMLDVIGRAIFTLLAVVFYAIPKMVYGWIKKRKDKERGEVTADT